MPSSTDPWASLRGLEPVSLCDWPGRVSLVLFLGGCNLRCPTCHNQQLAWQPETLPRLTREGALSFIAKRAPWLDGLVVSGGEPTHVSGVIDLLLELKTFGLPLKMDTNGLNPRVVRQVVACGAADVVAVDVKGPWEKYPDLSGGSCSARRARTSLEEIFSFAAARPEAFIFRCTKVPQLKENDLQSVKAVLPEGFELRLQDYVAPLRATLAA